MPRLSTVAGQPSWTVRSDRACVRLTRLGGHLGPVEFRVGDRTIAPLSVAPWSGEKLPSTLPALLRVLRGDFFCAPFGGNATPWRGERHPPHGETANARWHAASLRRAGDRVTLHATLATRVRRGRVDKLVSLVDGQTVVYQQHVLSGSRGPMPVGHHAMVKFPGPPGCGLISTSRFVRAQVFPGAFESPENRGYQSLKPGATFRTLRRVPLATGGVTDLSRYPARQGYEDLVMLTADASLPWAWTAVVFPQEAYLWFALRDPRVLRHTVLWISNGGRHYPPWNGRHTGVLGLEDITGYFHHGLAESARPNPLESQGIPTALPLRPSRPTVINYLFGVAPVPAGFDHVRQILPAQDGIEFVSASGRRAQTRVDLGFLAATGPLR